MRIKTTRFLLYLTVLTAASTFLLWSDMDASLERISRNWAENSKQLDDKWFDHEKKLEKTYNELKKRIKMTWDRLEKSTRYNFVKYSKDAGKKTKIAFKEGYIECEVIETPAKAVKSKIKKDLNNQLRGALKAKDGNNINYLKNQVPMKDIKKAQ